MTKKYSSTFVRGLWGESKHLSVPTFTLPKTYRDIENTLSYERSHPSRTPAPVINYCFGANNLEFLTNNNTTIKLLSLDPIMNFENQPLSERSPNPKGGINWGISFWHHKLYCMREAMRTHDEIIWMDWDCYLHRRLPKDFWRIMRKGAEFQGSLRRYRCRQCHWREMPYARRIVPHGAFLYCRSKALLDRAIELHLTKCRQATDEIAWAMTIDELIGGWKGNDYYKESKFEPYCYTTWNQVMRPEIILFQEGRATNHDNKNKELVEPP